MTTDPFRFHEHMQAWLEASRDGTLSPRPVIFADVRSLSDQRVRFSLSPPSLPHSLPSFLPSFLPPFEPHVCNILPSLLICTNPRFPEIAWQSWPSVPPYRHLRPGSVSQTTAISEQFLGSEWRWSTKKHRHLSNHFRAFPTFIDYPRQGASAGAPRILLNIA
jgi:hypothetical protein